MLGAFTAVFFWGGRPVGIAAVNQPAAFIKPVGEADKINAKFGICGAGPRSTCVVDGDTIWLYGTKIRIADIDTPEVTKPHCANEAAFGQRATRRLAELLNEAPFSVEPADRDEDRYGRKLRILTRNGHSLGQTLVVEGLAEEWNGTKIYWC